MASRPTALIADDEPLLREALARQLGNAWPELDIVAEARNGREAVKLFEAKRPDVCFLDVHMPGQRVREVRALNRAFAQGRADSTIHADTTNWIRGDTIVAYFDTLPPVDTSKGPEIRKLVSTLNAQAFYNLASSDTSLHRPAINYVKGRRITINFDEHKVANIAVDEKVAGIYIEPSNDTTATRTNTRPGTNRTPTRTPTRPVPGVRRP